VVPTSAIKVTGSPRAAVLLSPQPASAARFIAANIKPYRLLIIVCSPPPHEARTRGGTAHAGGGAERSVLALRWHAMTKYVIERELAGAGTLTEEQLREISLTSLRALGQLAPKVQWIHSYVTDNKVYCVYLAPDEETIREHARLAGLPADRISAVRRLLDPTNY
jgi:hypothetical protein